MHIPRQKSYCAKSNQKQFIYQSNFYESKCKLMLGRRRLPGMVKSDLEIQYISRSFFETENNNGKIPRARQT
jgi:hypothetical protein